jgi:ligand-binding sensor protein
MNAVNLGEVMDVSQWQRIQDHFGEVLGVTLRTVDSEFRPFTLPSNPTRFCAEIAASTPHGAAKCADCRPPSSEDLLLNDRWKDGYQCLLGLWNFAIPISIIHEKVIGCLLLGPAILGQRKKPEYYSEDASGSGMSLEAYCDGLREVKCFSFVAIQAVIELLKDVAGDIAQNGYQQFKLEKIVSLPKIGKMVHRFYVHKILDALLDVSFQALEAEFGSIMLVDKKKNELYMKIGRGIKKEAAKRARLKIGEGIAGLAASEKRFLLLDDKIEDERVKSRLARPEIKSAVVAPIQVKDDVLGVMNLGTTQALNKFNTENMAVLNQLVKMVDITLQDFPLN